MIPELWLRCAYRPALSLLPARMDSEVAAVVILAICLQESELQHRRQMGYTSAQPGGARGYVQLERIGSDEVLRHPASQAAARVVCLTLDYEHEDLDDVWLALEHNDVLAAAWARLALWRHPSPLPSDQDEAWENYLAIWRPGHPRPERWPASYGRAVEAVLG